MQGTGVISSSVFADAVPWINKVRETLSEIVVAGRVKVESLSHLREHLQLVKRLLITRLVLTVSLVLSLHTGRAPGDESHEDEFTDREFAAQNQIASYSAHPQFKYQNQVVNNGGPTTTRTTTRKPTFNGYVYKIPSNPLIYTQSTTTPRPVTTTTRTMPTLPYGKQDVRPVYVYYQIPTPPPTPVPRRKITTDQPPVTTEPSTSQPVTTLTGVPPLPFHPLIIPTPPPTPEPRRKITTDQPPVTTEPSTSQPVTTPTGVPPLPFHPLIIPTPPPTPEPRKKITTDQPPTITEPSTSQTVSILGGNVSPFQSFKIPNPPPTPVPRKKITTDPPPIITEPSTSQPAISPGEDVAPLPFHPLIIPTPPPTPVPRKKITTDPPPITRKITSSRPTLDEYVYSVPSNPLVYTQSTTTPRPVTTTTRTMPTLPYGKQDDQPLFVYYEIPTPPPTPVPRRKIITDPPPIITEPSTSQPAISPGEDVAPLPFHPLIIPTPPPTPVPRKTITTDPPPISRKITSSRPTLDGYVYSVPSNPLVYTQSTTPPRTTPAPAYLPAVTPWITTRYRPIYPPKLDLPAFTTQPLPSPRITGTAPHPSPFHIACSPVFTTNQSNFSRSGYVLCGYNTVHIYNDQNPKDLSHTPCSSSLGTCTTPGPSLVAVPIFRDNSLPKLAVTNNTPKPTTSDKPTPTMQATVFYKYTSPEATAATSVHLPQLTNTLVSPTTSYTPTPTTPYPPQPQPTRPATNRQPFHDACSPIYRYKQQFRPIGLRTLYSEHCNYMTKYTPSGHNHITPPQRE
ncbi:hypothetical protein CBL_06023 [Carabus blaptoides fortunei]